MSQGELLTPDETLSYAPPGATPSWFTPRSWLMKREAELLTAGLISGPFDLDPCGHLEAPVSQEVLRRGGVVYTVAENGLVQPWEGRRPFVNPPFDAASIQPFLARIQKHVEAKLVPEAVLHCPAWTDRSWWQDFIEADRRAGQAVVWFERGRLTYGWPGNPEGVGGDGARFPSALVVWRS